MRTGRQKDMKKLIATFRSFANAPKNDVTYINFVYIMPKFVWNGI